MAAPLPSAERYPQHAGMLLAGFDSDQHGTTYLVCTCQDCGALVRDGEQERHDRFHSALEELERTAHPLHAISGPAPAGDQLGEAARLQAACSKVGFHLSLGKRLSVEPGPGGGVRLLWYQGGATAEYQAPTLADALLALASFLA